MAYAEVSAATATALSQEQQAGTSINFGAGYIYDPSSQYQTPTLTPTAALGSAAGTVAANSSAGQANTGHIILDASLAAAGLIVILAIAYKFAKSKT